MMTVRAVVWMLRLRCVLVPPAILMQQWALHGATRFRPHSFYWNDIDCYFLLAVVISNVANGVGGIRAHWSPSVHFVLGGDWSLERLRKVRGDLFAYATPCPLNMILSTSIKCLGGRERKKSFLPP